MDPLKQIRFVKHGTVCLENEEAVVYVDPYDLDGEPHDADLIIITHAHSDHFSPADIEKICKPDTCYATTAEVAAQLERHLQIDDAYISHLSCEMPALCYEFGVMVMPVEAENVNHPLGFGFGVIVEMSGVRYYMSGDTDRLAQDADCDVLFVACDGIYNMPDPLNLVPRQIEAMDERPGLVVPYHYGLFAGTEQNGKQLAKVLKERGYKVKLLIK
ncbi:MAG TPA: MBL fold metallo-hydrolase [Candidatus Anaerofilum faecale]|nr:MBL fold metallo-hydrolase [Candidatus Anaerofilum faecale]